MVRSKSLVEELLALPEEERAELAGRLIESLGDDGAEAAWSGEIKARIDRLDAGEVETVPWTEARRQILGESKAD